MNSETDILKKMNIALYLDMIHVNILFLSLVIYKHLLDFMTLLPSSYSPAKLPHVATSVAHHLSVVKERKQIFFSGQEFFSLP